MANDQLGEKTIYSVKSNEQRLKSLDEHEREKAERKQKIKDALQNKDVKKHLKFDSDDEDNQGKTFVQKKLQLFDDQEPLKVEEHFQVKKISKKKRKLKDLQAQLTTTNDPRFQLSEQFLDDRERISDEDETFEHQEISIEEEKKKSLAILDQITNANASSNSKPKTKMIRFDPTKTEHRIYEIDSEVKTNEINSSPAKDAQPKSILKVTKNPTPVIDTTRRYELDQSKLKSVFDKATKSTEKSTLSNSFQFQFFNDESPIVTPTAKPIPPPTPISNGKAKLFRKEQNDSSSEEDEREEKLSEDEEKQEEKSDSGTFFFFDIDNRLKDGLDSFVRTEDINELERAWPTKRKEIAEALRTKHRKAIQHKDKRRIFNHRRRQHQPMPSKTQADMD